MEEETKIEPVSPEEITPEEVVAEVEALAEEEEAEAIL